MRNTIWVIMILGSLGGSLPTQAQWNTELSLGSIYDSNIDGYYTGQGAGITNMTLDVSRQSKQARFYYSGNGFVYGQNEPRSFLYNRVGLDMIFPIGQKRNRLVLGFAGANRMNRSVYNIYDYVGATGYVQGKWYVQKSLMMKLGYHVDWRTYQNMSVSKYIDQNATAQISKFLPSRTTLQADVQFGHKIREASEGQMVFGLQVAQALTRNTGLSLRYQKRINTTSEQDLLSSILRSLTDEDLLNSRYDYGGHQVSARLTQQLPAQARLIVEGGYEVRSYTDEYALDLNGDLLENANLRNDKLAFWDVDLELPLTQKMTTIFGYSFTNMKSNDIFYDYGARHSLSGRFQVGF